MYNLISKYSLITFVLALITPLISLAGDPPSLKELASERLVRDFEAAHHHTPLSNSFQNWIASKNIPEELKEFIKDRYFAVKKVAFGDHSLFFLVDGKLLVAVEDKEAIEKLAQSGYKSFRFR